jgi:acyl phosphate:glycerol-3-phosphate acyltransferase
VGPVSGAEVWPWVVAVVAGYLIGSVPVAVLVGRRHGVDPRSIGDRNPGYWNVRERVGHREAVPVFAGDTAKGIGAAAVGLALAPDGVWGVGYAAVAAAMVGHAWPVFAGFRGGRSVLAFVGGAVVLAPVPAAIAVAALVAVTLAARSFALGARVGMFAFPWLQLAIEGPHRTAATGALMSIIGLRFAQAAWAVRRSGPATSAPGAAPPG